MVQAQGAVAGVVMCRGRCSRTFRLRQTAKLGGSMRDTRLQRATKSRPGGSGDAPAATWEEGWMLLAFILIGCQPRIRNGNLVGASQVHRTTARRPMA